MNQSTEVLFKLIRIALGNEKDFSLPNVVNWEEVYELSLKQGVGAVACDGMLALKACDIDEDLRYKWMGQSMVIEQKYFQHKQALADLANFYQQQGIRMMLLKGYGLSLNYPVPEHRPSGDIDIFLTRDQLSKVDSNDKIWKLGDKAVERSLGIKVDRTHEHHTVFSFEGQTVENHYDFINTKGTISSRTIDKKLKGLVDNNRQEKDVNGQSLLLPSPEFNAIFIIRHMGQHFAGSSTSIRHLLDWCTFMMRCNEASDMVRDNWVRVVDCWREMGLMEFVKCINSICVNYLGVVPDVFEGQMSSNAFLVERVLDDVLQPEFDEKCEKKNVLNVVYYKTRRFFANGWKRRLVYKEGILEQFFTGSIAHMLRIRTITQ